MVVSQKAAKACLHGLLSAFDLSTEPPSDRDVANKGLSGNWESGISFSEMVPFSAMIIHVLLQDSYHLQLSITVQCTSPYILNISVSSIWWNMLCCDSVIVSPIKTGSLT